MLLPLVTDQLSGQLDDHSSKPDHEACAQLLSTVLDNLDRKDVVRDGHTNTETLRVDMLCYLIHYHHLIAEAVH